jgi:hypothetical protein
VAAISARHHCHGARRVLAGCSRQDQNTKSAGQRLKPGEEQVHDPEHQPEEESQEERSIRQSQCDHAVLGVPQLRIDTDRSCVLHFRPMAMGKRRQRPKQTSMWVATQHLLRSAAHRFYARLNQILDKADFDGYVEGLCQQFHAPRKPKEQLVAGIESNGTQ